MVQRRLLKNSYRKENVLPDLETFKHSDFMLVLARQMPPRYILVEHARLLKLSCPFSW